MKTGGLADVSAALPKALSRLGHRVTVYERGDDPGGVLQTGIPPYRLPRAVVDADTARTILARLGGAMVNGEV